MTETYLGEFRTGQGGVMTDEVGVITGEVTVQTQVEDSGELVVRVQYTDANEWYTLTGGRCTLADPRDGEPVHRLVLAVLERGGHDVSG